MKNENCAIVEELLPMYIEELSSPEVSNFIEEHLKTCETCRDTYQKMKATLHINPAVSKPNKRILGYINGARIWYLMCPLMALVFYRFGWETILHLYEGMLILCSFIFIASEVGYKSTWWDTECIELQQEGRKNSKKKWGQFYTRPFLLAIPSLLVLFIIELPRIIHYIGYIF